MRKAIAGDGEHDMLGRPATFNVLFCRNLIDESDHAENYTTPCRAVSVDQMIKCMIILELHGLNDVALDTAERFADMLGSRLDVERAIDLLADPGCRDAGAVTDLKRLQDHARDFEGSTSWRLTAPLRGLKRALDGIRAITGR
jgi:hypothetical protein